MALLWRRKKKSHPSCIHRLQRSESQQVAAIAEVSEDLVQTSPAQTQDTEVVTSIEPLDSKGRCQRCRKEQIGARRYRTKLIIGLFFPFALQALDTTIIASALPWIASDFRKFRSLSINSSIY